MIMHTEPLGGGGGEKLDSANQFEVTPGPDGTVVFSLVQGPLDVELTVMMSKGKALRLGAWLLAIADPQQGRARKMLESITTTKGTT